MTPTLNTQRLVLRQLTKVNNYHVSWLNDQETVQFSEQRHKRHTDGSVRKYITSFDQVSGHIWAIERADDNWHVGNITARIDRYDVADVGILLGDARGNGFGREAWTAVCNWLIDKEGGKVRKLSGGCMAVNKPMRRIFETTGFKLEGDRLNHMIWKGQMVNLLEYGRFR